METSLNIKQWSVDDRPREKLILKGVDSLSNTELLAILIGSGTKNNSAVQLGREILNQVQNDLNQLAHLSLNDLQKVHGIGEAKAITITACMELGRRRANYLPNTRPKINHSEDVYTLMKPHLLDLTSEEFWVILLNQANLVIKKTRISIGGVSSTVVDPKIVFKNALEHLASKIILVHNHPSGSLNPSHQDKTLTKKFHDAGNLLDVPVLDHLIFTNNGYFSFADEGIL